ncbi:MAG: sodium:proton antiporter [Clostridiales bacterium]|nr:sodium:proton antiporter [Clostridiales bacterium]
MPLIRNFPFFCIMLSMMCGISSAMLPGKIARKLTVVLAAVVACLNTTVLVHLMKAGESYHFLMGHFPAPWGNEIRIGPLEALLCTMFSIVLMLSALGGMYRLKRQVDPKKENIVCVMLDLVLAGTLSMLYTNDLFTGYVFIEIMTLASCALIMCRQNGRTMVSAMRYMIMSLLGSGMTLMAIMLTYTLTGHLLIENIHEAVAALYASGDYRTPLTVTIGLFFVGLGIKSALFPFHTWLADAYGYSTPAASAVLSSIVSKAYILLLLKIFVRMIGMDVVRGLHLNDLFFAFGVIAMVMGSLSAMHSHDLRRMVAYSSVAQIGYIYAGMGMGIEAGLVAAIYHMMIHSAAKSSLFISSSELADASTGSKRFSDLRGAGKRSPLAGVCFTVSAMSLVGVPVLGGFISKLIFSEAAFEYGGIHMWVMLLALAVSTVLNVLYLMKTVITLYRPARDGFECVVEKPDTAGICAMVGFVVLNVLLGVLAQPVLTVIRNGLQLFV